MLLRKSPRRRLGAFSIGSTRMAVRIRKPPKSSARLTRAYADHNLTAIRLQQTPPHKSASFIP